MLQSHNFYSHTCLYPNQLIFHPCVSWSGDLVKSILNQNLFKIYWSLKDAASTFETVTDKPIVPTRPKTGELLLFGGQNWVWSDCQICLTSVGMGQIGPPAVFGRSAEINLSTLLGLVRLAVWYAQVASSNLSHGFFGLNSSWSGVNSGVLGLNVNSGACLGDVGGQGGLANGAAGDILGFCRC